MAGTKIDGIAIAKSVKDRVSLAVDQLGKQGVRPCLATILVGNDVASATYVKNKHIACANVGITTRDHTLDANTSQSQLESLISDLNDDNLVHGILVQLPLPPHLDEFAAIMRISPLKDVDGITPHNIGLLAMGKAMLVACTPTGIMEMFDYHKISLEGKNVLIINRSNLVGKPLYHLLLRQNATVVTAHSKTTNLREQCLAADIIVTAVGDRGRFVLRPDMIKKGAIVIDVAITRHNNKLVGDTDYSEIIQKASYATPVPGGVGPMTVAMLLKNTVTSASMSSHLGQQ